ncbi:MAG: hypothetical protein JWL73_2836 [Actinomycetia bacterium]|nr:hypothetical protein [Actinomycetes bacterium]
MQDAPRTVAGILERGCAIDPQAEALVGRGFRFTYEGLHDAVERAAGGLAALGIGTGDRVAASMGNRPELVVAFLATMRLGGVWVGINRLLAPPEKQFVLDDAGVSVFFADDDVADRLEAAIPDLPRLHHLIRVGHDEPGSPWQRVLDGDPTALPPLDTIDPSLPAAISYTSGTTGQPKGVVHSQHNLLLPGLYLASTPEYPVGIRLGLNMPLTILNLVILGPLVAFSAAECCVLVDRTDVEGLTEWVRSERIETMAAVPTTLYDLTTNPAVDVAALSSWRLVQTGGADCPDSLLDDMYERLGKFVTRSYGLTEAPTLVTVEDGAPPRVKGSSGKPLPYLEVVIVDDDDQPVPQGEVGEICVRAASSGPWAHTWTPMLHYLHDPEATAVTLRNGLLHTGDVGRLDQDSNLFVTDRRSNLIIRGSANVYPAEVERVLQAFPSIAGSAVVGRPDARLGERVVAYVELASDTDLESLREHCLQHLARYKVPAEFIVVDELPRNAMGKVAKTELTTMTGVPLGASSTSAPT